MKLGDTVRVRASGRLVGIVEVHGAGFYEVENAPSPVSISARWDIHHADSAEGIYHARELDPV